MRSKYPPVGWMFTPLLLFFAAIAAVHIIPSGFVSTPYFDQVSRQPKNMILAAASLAFMLPALWASWWAIRNEGNYAGASVLVLMGVLLAAPGLGLSYLIFPDVYAYLYTEKHGDKINKDCPLGKKYTSSGRSGVRYVFEFPDQCPGLNHFEVSDGEYHRVGIGDALTLHIVTSQYGTYIDGWNRSRAPAAGTPGA